MLCGTFGKIDEFQIVNEKKRVCFLHCLDFIDMMDYLVWRLFKNEFADSVS